MDKTVKDLLAKERKRAREVAELKSARERVMQTKSPDPKLLAAIDKELKDREVVP